MQYADRTQSWDIASADKGGAPEVILGAARICVLTERSNDLLLFPGCSQPLFQSMVVLGKKELLQTAVFEVSTL